MVLHHVEKKTVTLVVTVYVTFLQSSPRLCMLIQHHKMDRMIINVERDPEIIIKSLLSNVDDDDYHDFEQNVPVLSRTTEGLSVLQLFTLMIGSVPANRICCRKPTAVTYSGVFVVDFTCIRCIDGLRADDNGVWVHGGKPRKTYSVEFDGTGSEIVSVAPLDSDDQSTSHATNHFTLVRLYH